MTEIELSALDIAERHIAAWTTRRNRASVTIHWRLTLRMQNERARALNSPPYIPPIRLADLHFEQLARRVARQFCDEVY